MYAYIEPGCRIDKPSTQKLAQTNFSERVGGQEYTLIGHMIFSSPAAEYIRHLLKKKSLPPFAMVLSASGRARYRIVKQFPFKAKQV